MTCELVHASHSLPKWQAVKLTFLAPQCILSFLHHFISSISNNQLYLAGGSTEGLNFPLPIPCILGFLPFFLIYNGVNYNISEDFILGYETIATLVEFY